MHASQHSWWLLAFVVVFAVESRYKLGIVKEASDGPLGQEEGLASGPGPSLGAFLLLEKTLHFGTSLVLNRELCLF